MSSMQQQQLDALLAIQASLEKQERINDAWIAEMHTWREVDLARIKEEWRRTEARDLMVATSNDLFHANVLAFLQARQEQDKALSDRTLATHEQWRNEDVARVEEQHRDAVRYLHSTPVDAVLDKMRHS